ncbi:hypothetical protein MRB53_037866 [Persea americana]|nr:hypothetical protein MRB53_037866 [Persea americana]
MCLRRRRLMPKHIEELSSSQIWLSAWWNMKCVERWIRKRSDGKDDYARQDSGEKKESAIETSANLQDDSDLTCHFYSDTTIAHAQNPGSSSTKIPTKARSVKGEKSACCKAKNGPIQPFILGIRVTISTNWRWICNLARTLIVGSHHAKEMLCEFRPYPVEQ